jgi:hypothetical protein
MCRGPDGWATFARCGPGAGCQRWGRAPTKVEVHVTITFQAGPLGGVTPCVAPA